MSKVVFPCDLDHWWIVKDKLHQLKEDCLNKDLSVKDIAIAHQIIVYSVHGIDVTEVPWGDTTYCGLVKYFRKHATLEEKTQFIKKTLPSIIDLGLEVELLLPTDGIDISQQQKGETTVISRKLCCSIVACGFLCLFPVSGNPRGRGCKLNVINFDKFFANLPLSSQNAKLRCILHFFNRVADEKSRLTGAVLFTRQVVTHGELPNLDTWLNCPSKLCAVVVQEAGLIEDAGCHTVEVDFANRSIGGGVLGRGRVQEEIRFTVCPELIVSMLFMEVMEENEAIIIQGFEQFSAVAGYAQSLTYIGDHQDKSEVDEHGNLKNMLCAIDAISYKHENNGGRQYKDTCVLRDLNKAYAGFCTPFKIPQSVCDRSFSVESYQTAVEEANEAYEPDDEQFSQQIDVFVERLLQGAITLALADVSKTFSRDGQSTLLSSSGEHSLQRQSSMDHLEVNFRDWYASYRRRSSNLSDLSSRRSSYDVASRRSSLGSARGYSSEYSSEFEDIYDNFQSQEQRYKYHTITEEVGSSMINEFAISLAESLLKQGTEEASGFVPQVFHGTQPSYDIRRPLPVRISTGSLSTVDSVENEDAIVREDCIRQYVDKMFENVWPFNENESDVGKELQSNRKMKQMILGESESENLASVSLIEKDVDTIEDVDEITEDSGKVCNVSEETLLTVADSIVAIAFEEALSEYRYLMGHFDRCNIYGVSSSSEWSQSENSIDIKDQSDSSTAEFSQSVPRRHLNSNFDPAVTVAEKVLAGLFSNTQSDLPVSPSSSPKSSGAKPQSNIPKPNTCDTKLTVVGHTSPKAHSSSSDETELSASRRRELYSQVADRILFSGLTPKSAGENRQSCNDAKFSSLNISSDSSHSDSSVGRRESSLGRQSLSVSCDHSEKSSQIGHKSPSNIALRRSTSSCSESKSTDSRSSEVVVNVVSTDNKRVGTASPKYYSNSANPDVRTSPNHKSNSSADACKGHDSKLLDDKSSPRQQTHSGSKALLGTKGSKLHHLPAHQGRIAGKTGRLFATGNRKNYDQFANSLSRDLLTNVFLQVQEHNEPVAYPRRSSEPMQISNGAALQRYEHTYNTINGKRGQKSKTDEDISQFEGDWMQQFNSQSSSGFRDPVLSRFAEELMKANVSVPPLQLPVVGDVVSISSSSQSVCSTISSFRDPLLASFEEELLSTVDKRSAKTRMSWSKARGTMCSPRLSGNSTSSSSRDDRKLLGVSMSVESETSAISNRSYGTLFYRNLTDFAEMLSTRIVCESLIAVYRSAKSDQLDRSNESKGESASSEDSVTKEENVSRLEGVSVAIDIYSDMLVSSILRSSILVAGVICANCIDQNKVVTWSEETECVHYSDKDNLDISDHSVEQERARSCSESGHSSASYEDALDIPYQRIEEFADVLASKVLINSVAITRREHMSSLRMVHGRPIATGNWGCGAFGGNPHLKSLIQWMAASYAGCPLMLYYTFHHPQMSQFQDVVDAVLARGWDVSKLMQVVRRYCIIAEEEIAEKGFISRELFDIIIQGEIFPGV